MRKIIFFLSFFTIVAFSNEFSQDEIEDRVNLGCKAYPSWHYKSCQSTVDGKRSNSIKIHY